MSVRDRRADVVRLAVLAFGLVLLAALVSLAFAAAGRPAHAAIAAGCGLVGVGIVLLGIVLLGLARRAEGRITQGTGLGALALSVPFLTVALVV